MIGVKLRKVNFKSTFSFYIFNGKDAFQNFAAINSTAVKVIPLMMMNPFIFSKAGKVLINVSFSKKRLIVPVTLILSVHLLAKYITDTLKENHIELV